MADRFAWDELERVVTAYVGDRAPVGGDSPRVVVLAAVERIRDAVGVEIDALTRDRDREKERADDNYAAFERARALGSRRDTDAVECGRLVLQLEIECDQLAAAVTTLRSTMETCCTYFKAGEFIYPQELMERVLAETSRGVA